MQTLVDPELSAGLAAIPSLDHLNLETLGSIRAQMRERARQNFSMVQTDGIAVSQIQIPGPSNCTDLRVLIYRPLSSVSRVPALLHFHGGGLVFGAPEGRHPVSAGLTKEFDCVVLSIDYRLAPETPYPGAVEDGYCALRWLHENAASLNVNPAQIIVVGESAGGGLAAALAVLARDRAEYSIAAQILAYPMLDDRPSTTRRYPSIGRFVWTRENNQFGWSCYLGAMAGTEAVPPYAAAARCKRFKDLPPAYIACGDLDLFIVESMNYARSMIRSAVPVELRVYPGAFHGFDLIESAGISKRFRMDLKGGVARALGR